MYVVAVLTPKSQRKSPSVVTCSEHPVFILMNVTSAMAEQNPPPDSSSGEGATGGLVEALSTRLTELASGEVSDMVVEILELAKPNVAGMEKIVEDAKQKLSKQKKVAAEDDFEEMLAELNLASDDDEVHIDTLLGAWKKLQEHEGDVAKFREPISKGISCLWELLMRALGSETSGTALLSMAPSMMSLISNFGVRLGMHPAPKHTTERHVTEFGSHGSKSTNPEEARRALL